MKIGIVGDSVPHADAAARALGLIRAEVVLISNRSSDGVRGLTLDGLVILPGVQLTERTSNNLFPALVRGRGQKTAPILDLSEARRA